MNMNQKAKAGTGDGAELGDSSRKTEITKEIFSPVIRSFKEFKYKLTIKMNVGVSI